MANAEIVAIGTELLLGQIVDTNSAWMAERLTPIGVNLFYKTVVGDNPGRMGEVIDRALDRSDVVITSGGLGPTQDDLTREAIAQVTGRKLVLDRHLLDQIDQRFRRRLGMTMTSNNRRQALIPEGATPIENPNGTAPAFIVEDRRGAIFALPGVPFEMKWLFDNEVVPYLRTRFNLSEVITYKMLKVAELGESRVDDRIGHLIANSTNPTLGTLAHPGQVDIRIAAKASSHEEATRIIAPVEEEVRRLLGGHVFAVDDEDMEDAVGKLLGGKNTTLAVYEDLTGGALAARLHQVGPAFVEAAVANSPATMRRLMAAVHDPAGIDDLLQDPAAATKALAMAVRNQAGSHLGLALHAVADPGDTAENLAKGETFLAITDGASFKSQTLPSAGRGGPDRARMSFNALVLLRQALMEGF